MSPGRALPAAVVRLCLALAALAGALVSAGAVKDDTSALVAPAEASR